MSNVRREVQLLSAISTRIESMLGDGGSTSLAGTMAGAAVSCADRDQVLTVPVRLPAWVLTRVHNLAKDEFRTFEAQLVAMLKQYSPLLTGVEAQAQRIIEAAELAAEEDGSHQ
jgi:hypothetical protein